MVEVGNRSGYRGRCLRNVCWLRMQSLRDVDGNGSRGGRCGETTTFRRINYIMSWCSLARSMEMSDMLLKANTWNLHYYSMVSSCMVPLFSLDEEPVA